MAFEHRLRPHSVHTAATSLIAALIATASHTATASDKLHWRALVEVQATGTHFESDAQGGNRRSWLEGGNLGLRYGAGEDLQLGQAGIEASYRLQPEWQLRGAAIAYYQGDAEPQAELALTEAFLHHRPIPSGRWRQEWKLGLFHVPLSLENRGPLWSSPYSSNASTINSWVGEELRTLGAEWRWRLPAHHNPRRWDLSGYAAIYGFNDPTGAMLTWRGWASHNRQAGIGSDYPIAPLPSLRPGYTFEHQAPEYEPFVEVDNRAGFYLGGEAARGRNLRLTALYYDNQGDPGALEDGQYAWRTRFQQLGLHWRMPGNTELLSQYLRGDTLMGTQRGARVKADYWSAYLLLSKRWQQHRLSLRWDRFEVIDRDTTYRDSNDEHGRSLTASYSYRWRKAWKASLDYIDWRSERTARHYLVADAAQPQLHSRQWQLTLRRYW